MKKILFLLSLAVATPAVADYHHTRTANCDPVSMRRALDDATMRGRAVITTVKCDAAPVVRAARVAPVYAVRYVRPARVVVPTCCGGCRF